MMGKEHVSHKEIAQFAIDRINLPKDKAAEYRAQAARLREKLSVYVKDHPDFSLKKMLLSGSLAKGTALRSLNDIDVACYVSGVDAPQKISELVDYLADRLRKAFPNFSYDQVQSKTHCVTVSFKGSGLDVDVVPILYYNDPDWYGHLVNQEDGSFLETCIPKHLDFIKTRKQKQPEHFSQVIRLAKYWVRLMKKEREGFRFKSFMVELVMAKLLDNGADFSNYPEALQNFFTYIAKSNMREMIAFSDYHPLSKLSKFIEPVKVIDPVNLSNNAAKLYTDSQADAIVNAALDAGDAIDAASTAITKEMTEYYWQKVFGPTFKI